MKSYKHVGAIIAMVIIAAWAASLILLLSLEREQILPLLIPSVLLQTFLYTGMFITAHDAIHGSVFTRRHRLNAGIGAFCLFVYALFSYRNVREKHFDHHRFPGSLKDPDFHDGKNCSFAQWYFTFMRRYITWRQLIGMALVFNILHHLVHLAVGNLLLFWVLPSLLSTLQLFYFGTYLPHRRPTGGYTNRHHAVSSSLGVFWSFIACWHFGYHWEHHEYPGTPWWKLPEKRRQKHEKQHDSFNNVFQTGGSYESPIDPCTPSAGGAER